MTSNLVNLLPFGAFVSLLFLQHFFPTRDLTRSGLPRMLHNLLLFMVNALILRLMIPLTMIAAASWAAAQPFGIFNVLVIDQVMTIVLCVVLLDFAVYWQHVATHRFSLLWRLHKVHHADNDMDVTTAIRFHPIELILSLAYKSLFVVLLGAPVAAVVLFELALFIFPAFNHSNLAVPRRLDGVLRWVIATPDVHRSHHSTIVQEQNTNYGFFLIWWDKLFRTYTPQPALGHTEMKIGLEGADSSCERVDQMLLAPFR